MTPEMRQAAYEALESERRSEFRGSRGRFQRMMKQFQMTSLGATPQTALVSVAPSSDLSRLRRVRLHVVIPENNSLIAGWLGFIRQTEGLDVSTGGHAPSVGDPSVLRPIVWQSNADHSVYYDAYLPAVNLATGGALHAIGAAFSGSHALYGVATWVEERDLGA